MSKSKVRPIVVDGEVYLWKLNSYEDVWSGTLVVYSSQHKKGHLEVHYPFDDYFTGSEPGSALFDGINNRNLNIHEPEPTARVIRYARQQLGWNPDERVAPLVIEHGFEILKQVGYIAKPIQDTQAITAISLDDLKQKVSEIEEKLGEDVFVELGTFERDGRKLHLAMTDRLRRVCLKDKVWKSKAFLTALKNAEYGFDEVMARSSGGRDGIFLLDRDFSPPNPMMHKIFNHFLDKPDSGVDEMAAKLEAKLEDLKAVRLVSHHMRLLGVLYEDENEDWLILVDYDQTK
jgi:hypothetical protein